MDFTAGDWLGHVVGKTLLSVILSLFYLVYQDPQKKIFPPSSLEGEVLVAVFWSLMKESGLGGESEGVSASYR